MQAFKQSANAIQACELDQTKQTKILVDGEVRRPLAHERAARVPPDRRRRARAALLLGGARPRRHPPRRVGLHVDDALGFRPADGVGLKIDGALGRCARGGRRGGGAAAATTRE